jgi:uncharacterized protein YbjT (DUF2867 family)
VTSPILVTGGTGTLGRLVVPRLRSAGHEVRVLTRHRRTSGEGIEYVTGDLAEDEGVGAAVAGTEIIVHCAGTSKGDEVKTRHLLRAASRGMTRHLVYISVIGADRVPVAGAMGRATFGYFASKLASEQAIAASGVPWTTLRAAQFHESLAMVARQMARLPVIPAPSGFRCQPVSAAEVADRLVELALGAPAGLVPGMAGPQVRQMAGLLRAYLRARGKHRLIMPVPFAGRAARAVKAGALLAPDGVSGRLTWEDFLAEGPGAPLVERREG